MTLTQHDRREIVNRPALRSTESVWRDAHSGGYIAEIRGLLDQETGVHEWIRLGVYGTRKAAMEAIYDTRDFPLPKTGQN